MSQRQHPVTLCYSLAFRTLSPHREHMFTLLPGPVSPDATHFHHLLTLSILHFVFAGKHALPETQSRTFRPGLRAYPIDG